MEQEAIEFEAGAMPALSEWGPVPVVDLLEVEPVSTEPLTAEQRLALGVWGQVVWDLEHNRQDVVYDLAHTDPLNGYLSVFSYVLGTNFEFVLGQLQRRFPRLQAQILRSRKGKRPRPRCWECGHIVKAGKTKTVRYCEPCGKRRQQRQVQKWKETHSRRNWQRSVKNLEGAVARHNMAIGA